MPNNWLIAYVIRLKCWLGYCPLFLCNTMNLFHKEVKFFSVFTDVMIRKSVSECYKPKIENLGILRIL